MERSTHESYDRRRAQVRKAQKTHRERKATYVKSLEVEVAELRNRNAVLAAEAATSKDVIRQLRETLASRDAPFQASCAVPNLSTPPTEGPLANCSMGNTTFPNQSLEVHYPAHESTAAVMQPAKLGDESNAIINFVLSLEQPCIYHHRLYSPELLITGDIGATGHSSMLSNIVVNRAPGFSLNPLAFGYRPDAKWQTPIVELEQLLETSKQLGLDPEEITPIQIWNLVRQHPKFEAFTLGHLDMLRSRVHSAVKCYGFGAVLHRPTAEEALEEIFKNL